MSDVDAGEADVEIVTLNNSTLPKDIAADAGTVKLFSKWSFEDIEVKDISLTYERSRELMGHG